MDETLVKEDNEADQEIKKRLKRVIETSMLSQYLKAPSLLSKYAMISEGKRYVESYIKIEKASFHIIGVSK